MRRQTSSRWALRLFAAALVLKAAMPWLASASAQLQGKTLVEVCTVYGVALVAPAGDAPAREHGVAPHGGEACALSALALLAVPEVPVRTVATPWPLREGAARVGTAAARVHDRCAAWVARLRHGPPGVA